MSPPSWPAPGSGPPGSPARVLYAVSAADAAAVAVAMVTAVPSLGHVIVGGGGAVNISPLTVPTLSVVSVYIHPAENGMYGSVVSWNPVIVVEAPVVPISPLTHGINPLVGHPGATPKAPERRGRSKGYGR